MPTLDDLRRSLTTLERHAPSEDVLADRVRSQLTARPPRRFVLPALAAACVIAVAVVTAVVVSRHDDDPVRPPVAARGTELRWAFSVGAVPGYRIVREQITPDVQIAATGTPGRGLNQRGGFTIYVFGPGKLAATTVRTLKAGHPVAGEHLQGYFARIRLPGYLPSQYGAGRAVGWQYAAGAWAVVLESPELPIAPGARSVLLRAAEAVRIRPSDELTLPFALHYLPPGQAVASATISYVDSDAGPVDPIPAIETTGVHGPGALMIERDREPDCVAQRGRPIDSINGHRTWYSRQSGLLMSLGDNTCLSIVASSGPALADQRAQMIKIAQGAVTTPDLLRPSTWIPASRALP